MVPRSSRPLLNRASVVAPRERFRLPSWLVSTACHLGLFALLVTTFDATPRGPATEDTRTVGIVIQPREPAEPPIASAEPTNSGELEPAGSEQPGQPSDRVELAPPSDPTTSLPDLPKLIGPGISGESGVPAAGELAKDSGGGRAPTEGRVRTSVFGVSGEGYKFVYVFDRSGSMGGSGRTALDAAKSELLKSLADLSDIHQFEIVFYNEEPTIMQLVGPGRMVFANDSNRQAAKRFVGSIPADGATDHEQALLLALRLRPDVIFFLTDADEPTLTRRQLAHLREVNGGRTAINTIEFGLGPSLGGENFLKRLARENGGQNVYFDLTRLRGGASE